MKLATGKCNSFRMLRANRSDQLGGDCMKSHCVTSSCSLTEGRGGIQDETARLHKYNMSRIDEECLLSDLEQHLCKMFEVVEVVG